LSTQKRTQLLDGETILWKGKPVGAPFTMYDLVMILAVLFGSVMLLNIVKIVIVSFFSSFVDNPLYRTVVIGCVTIPIFLILIIFFSARWNQRKNTYYFITNLRAIIYKRVFNEVFISVDFNPYFNMDMRAGKNGLGDIFFNTTSRLDMFTQLERFRRTIDSGSEVSFRYASKPFSASFLGISDAEGVYQIIKQASGYEPNADLTVDDSFDF